MSMCALTNSILGYVTLNETITSISINIQHDRIINIQRPDIWIESNKNSTVPFVMIVIMHIEHPPPHYKEISLN